MKKFIPIFISLMLIITISFADGQKKQKVKKIKDAEFKSVLVDVIDVMILPEVLGSKESMWVMKFENGVVVPALKSVTFITETVYATWFVGKKYRVWTDKETFGWRADLIEPVGIPMIDQEVEKRLSKKAKK